MPPLQNYGPTGERQQYPHEVFKIGLYKGGLSRLYAFFNMCAGLYTFPMLRCKRLYRVPGWQR